MRYRLRTLLIVLALGPPALALMWWGWPHLSDLLWPPKLAPMMSDPEWTPPPPL